MPTLPSALTHEQRAYSAPSQVAQLIDDMEQDIGTDDDEVWVLTIQVEVDDPRD